MSLPAELAHLDSLIDLLVDQLVQQALEADVGSRSCSASPDQLCSGDTARPAPSPLENRERMRMNARPED
jgi:hypothetical protein